MTTDDEPVTPDSSHSPNDEELIALINRGDAFAFEVLYRRHRDWVVNLAHRFTGSEDLALDVMQETFLYLLRKFPGFQLRANLKTFLYPAVKNLSIAARRKAQRFAPAEESQRFLDAFVMSDPSDSRSGELATLLGELSEDQREVLLLRFVDGLTLLEISGAMNIRLGTVKSRLHHVLTLLRTDPRTKEFFGR